MSNVQEVKLTDLLCFLPAVQYAESIHYREIYEENRDRIYSLAFRMTNHELAAETLTINVFYRAFAMSARPGSEVIDRALIAELRESMIIGALTLNCEAVRAPALRRNVKRLDLEQALLTLPATERLVFLMHDVESYDHPRIARTLGLSEEESQKGLHQARLRVREVLRQLDY